MVKKKNQTGQLKGMIHTAQCCFALQKSGRKKKKMETESSAKIYKQELYTFKMNVLSF